MTIFYGYLLRKAVGKAPFTIKRSSAAYILWYVFDRLWHVTSAANSRLFGGTIFESWIYRAYGGSIGKNNYFEGKDVRLPFMLKTGDNVVVEAGAKLETLVIKKNGDVSIDQLVLGTDTVIGPNCHVGLGAKIGASCMIKSLSVIQRRQQIADSKIVTGCDVADLYSSERAGMRSFVDQNVASLGWHVVSLWISFIPTIMAYLITAVTFHLASGSPNMLKILPLCYPILRNVSQVFIAICIRLLRCLLLGRRANSCWEKVYSKSFLRRQLAKSLYQSSISTFNGTPLYNIVSRFVFGATTDTRSRFTPNIDEPDLTRIGHNVFGANGVLLRNTSFYPGGIVRYGEIEIGDKVMILDRAVVTPDTVLKKNVMVGPLTSVNEVTSHDEGTLLLGTPALNLNRKAEGEGGKMGNMSLVSNVLQCHEFDV
jgi:acetyltransferase-like isoleucine patch superfamily enzyme